MKNKRLTVIIPAYNQANKITIGLNSIPADPRIEIIVIDDGSTDQTFETVCCYMDDYQDKQIELFKFPENKGVSYAINEGLDKAQGEYIVLLGSDGDYFLPNTIEKALNEWLTGEDLIFYDIIDNTGHVRRLRENTVRKHPGSTKFMRREFVGDTRCPINRRRAEDVTFTEQLLDKNPTMKFLCQIVKHYNFPREGSLTWNARHGVTDKLGFKKEKNV